MRRNHKIKIGISRCLLGEPVRYDGQHKHDRYLTDTLGRYFNYVGVCPEVECGLPVPREAMRLTGDPAAPRLVTVKTGLDHTERMAAWSAGRINALEREDLCGFIFKSRSPSSGMEGVKVYNNKGDVIGRAPGLFAGAFVQRFPNLPVIDEGRLHDPDLRENFIVRVFTLHRFRQALRTAPTLQTLMDFHARNKLLIMSHNETGMRRLGRLLAGLRARDAQAAIPAYETRLMQAMQTLATVKKHTNILQHMYGFLRARLEEPDKRELLEVIEQFHQGLVPLIVPVTLLRHHARRCQSDYLQAQYYLQPHPLELKLRNHA